MADETTTPENPAGNGGDEAAGEAPEPSFLQFLSGMAMQTMVHLGMMSNPMTNERAVDLPNAKYSIDLLGILREKTEGNLTEEETRYFDTMLANVRMGYVQVVSGGEGGPAPEAGAETAPEGETPAPGGAEDAAEPSGAEDDRPAE
jgi:hypothetical protein